MITTSDSYKDAISARTRKFANKITIGNIEITNIKKLEIIDTFNSDSENLTMGSACSRQLTLEFYVPSTLVNFSKEAITVESGLKLQNDTYEYVSDGVYYPETVNSENGNVTVKVKAYDLMSKLNGQYEPTVTLPTTDTAIINDICTQHGITFIGKTLGTPIAKIYEGTEAQTIGYMAGLQGLNAYITKNNELDFCYNIMPTLWSDYSNKNWCDVSNVKWCELMRKERG